MNLRQETFEAILLKAYDTTKKKRPRPREGGGICHECVVLDTVSACAQRSYFPWPYRAIIADSSIM